MSQNSEQSLKKLPPGRLFKNPWLLYTLAACLIMVPYLIVNRWPLDRYSIGFMFGEESIPFLPWTFAIYASLFLQYLVVVFRMSARQLKTGFLLFCAMVALGLVCFVLVPIEFPRELFATPGPVVRLVRIIDGPGNCFPSLHVAATVFFAACYGAIEKSIWKRAGLWIWALLIAASVLTTKQHYVVDILGGIVLALPFCWAFARYVKKVGNHSSL